MTDAHKFPAMQRVAGGADPAELEIEVAALGEPKEEIKDSGLLAEIQNLRWQDIKTLVFYAVAGMVTGMICGVFAGYMYTGSAPAPQDVATINAAAAAGSVSYSAAAATTVAAKPVANPVEAVRTNRIGDTIKIEAAVKKPNPVAKPRNTKMCAKCEKAKYAGGITCLARIQKYMNDMSEVASYHAVGAAAIHGKFPCSDCKKCM